MRVESQFKVTLLGSGVPTPRLERFEYAAHAVIAGNEDVVKYGKHRSLIHEVAIARRELMSEPYLQRIMAFEHLPRVVVCKLVGSA